MEHTNWIQIVTLILGPIGAGFGAYLGLRITLVRIETEVTNVKSSMGDLRKEVSAVEDRLSERIESNENRIGRIESTYFRGSS